MIATHMAFARIGVAVILPGLLALGQCRGDVEEGESEMGDSSGSAAVAVHTNRLAKETSPYLLQHAHNPVDWYPWGPEALEKAKRENKIIFLSIGYSACHWCHVMERESFKDPETAAILNAHFVAIKVDREERPDLDEIYMTAVQMMTGGGGWPLSVFLTPDLKPFYGGTYYPPEDRHGVPGFKRMLMALADLWREKSKEVAHNAENITRAIQAQLAPALSRAKALDESVFIQVAAELRSVFDSQWGGFGSAPKFPPCAAIAFLLRQYLHSGEKDLLKMATVTLDKMALGGLYDQIGGGFHRYATDAHWLVPHFEKMLYDNALLAQVYLEAWQATHKVLYRRISTETLDYILGDMTDTSGGFHSAEDADSEGKEGKYYIWEPAEIRAALGKEDGTLFCEYYGVTDAGNFEGKNILHIPNDPSEFARQRQIPADDLENRLALLRQKLREVRARRIRPGKDDKVLAAWNGMTISALARGYQVLEEDRFLKAAERAADFVLTDMMRDGLLLRTYRSGSDGKEKKGLSKLPAYLDDYAQMANALIDLYEATFELRWLKAADKLSRKMVTDFWDDKNVGFFYTSTDHKDLLVRAKPYYDGAVPSGNAAATLALLRLAKLFDNTDYAGKAEAVLSTMQESLYHQPRAHLNLLCAADFRFRPTREIAIAGRPKNDATRRLLAVIHTRFLPNKVLACFEPDAPNADVSQELIPLLRAKKTIGGKTTVYICENYQCKRPVVDAAEFEKILDTMR